MKIYCDEGFFYVNDDGDIVTSSFAATWLHDVDCVVLPPDAEDETYLADCVIVWKEEPTWWDEDSGITNSGLVIVLVASVFLATVGGIYIGTML